MSRPPLAPRVLVAAVVLCAVASRAVRTQALDGGAVALRQACLDATTDALVLNVAAHPDDEADRTLVWLRHRHGVRTVTLYSTYGSGGQNAIGREIGADLGRIRVRETLAAARHTGVEVRWLGFADFGYSKSAEETFGRWGEREVVTRMAAALEALDPDVVFTNHAPNRGHGHHRASAIGLRRALERRAEGGRQVPLLERLFRDPRAVPDWECDPFEFDPVRGTTFARQASAGRHEHRTQGPWRPHDPMRRSKDRWRMVFPQAEGVATDPLQHFGSVLREPAFRAVWAGLGDLDALGRSLAAFGEDRSVAEHVAAARQLLPMLREAGDALPETPAGRRARRRLLRRIDALERVVLAGSGVQIETYVDNRWPTLDGGDLLARGIESRLRVLVHAVRDDGIAVLAARCRDSDGEPVAEDGRGRLILNIPVTVPAGAGVMSVGLEPEALDVDVALQVDGLTVGARRTIHARAVDPVQARWGRDCVFVPRGRNERMVSLNLEVHGGDEIAGDVVLDAPEGVIARAFPPRVTLSEARPVAHVLVRVAAPGGMSAPRGVLRATLGPASADLSVVRVGDVAWDGGRIGLVRGPDDTLQRVLEDLHVPFEVLDETRLSGSDLGSFGTIVLDIRAYHHRPDLADHRERLLRFCHDGGRVVSFYHKPGEWNPRDGRPLLAPYPLEVGVQRVSQEDVPVVLLHPESPLWNEPCRITVADFEGWVQERGLNFPTKWADDWQPMVVMADRGEPPLSGGLLLAHHGEGSYVYCSLALYRQLRVGHRGALRILLNLLHG